MSHSPHCTRESLDQWFRQHLGGRFVGLHITVDRDEVRVIVELPRPDDAAERADVERHLGDYGDETAPRRAEVAAAAEDCWGRQVAWGARCDDVLVMFNQLSTPVMTRLRIDERTILDTLIDGGVARSRSEALAWCVRRVAHHESDWIERLRRAMIEVENVRAQGPGSGD